MNVTEEVKAFNPEFAPVVVPGTSLCVNLVLNDSGQVSIKTSGEFDSIIPLKDVLNINHSQFTVDNEKPSWEKLIGLLEITLQLENLFQKFSNEVDMLRDKFYEIGLDPTLKGEQNA